MDDLESVSDDSDGLGFLTGVSSGELEGSDESLDNGAVGFSEALLLISSSSVGSEDHSFAGVDGDVVNEAWVADGDILVGPSGEELGLDIGGLALGFDFSHCGDNYLIIIDIKIYFKLEL